MSALREPTSFTLVLRDRQAPAAERVLFRGPTLLRAGTKPVGSPGSAVFSDQAWNQIVGRLRLSRREGEIVRGVFDDRTEFAIGAELGMSPHTVHTHVERLHQKLGVTDRVQLILCIMQEFLRLPASRSIHVESIRARPPGLPLPAKLSAVHPTPVGPTRLAGRGVP